MPRREGAEVLPGDESGGSAQPLDGAEFRSCPMGPLRRGDGGGWRALAAIGNPIYRLPWRIAMPCHSIHCT
jgi:hypothetical protein